MRLCHLALIVCLTVCAVSAQTISQPDSSNNPNNVVVYDMLDWMTMRPDLRDAHHLTGTANPIYTHVAPHRIYWTKTEQGFPWDIQLYDNNYIYLWVTELDWRNPRTYKVFHSPRLGRKNLPLAPRYARGGYPGSTITISDSTYEIHSDCNRYVTKNLGHVVNEVWGPYKENLGGDLPEDLTTLVVSYRYTCNANYSNCQHKEEYHFAKPYGLVKWQHARPYRGRARGAGRIVQRASYATRNCTPKFAASAQTGQHAA